VIAERLPMHLGNSAAILRHLPADPHPATVRRGGERLRANLAV